MDFGKDNLGDKLELSRFINRVKQKWPLFISFVILGLVAGLVTSRYKKQLFQANSLIKIDDTSTDLSDFLAIEMFSESFNQYNKVLTETKIVSSRTMIEKALDKLSLGVRYYKHGLFSSFELYKRSPINLNIITEVDEGSSLTFKIEIF